MKIVVLGAGAQGRVIAEDLARSLPRAVVTVADLHAPVLPAGVTNLRGLEADLSSPEAVARLLATHDLGVGALPSRFGYGAMRAAIDAKKPLVDVSFSAEDPLTLDADAKRAGVSILPDCGLAPGLSHLLLGDLLARGSSPLELEILVGGVAQDKTQPYGYAVTWSLDDLMEEYTRPARYVKGGKLVEEPVLERVETTEIPGVGTMEAFVSDGLRTLLSTAWGVPDMAEKTLRWPGHVAAIKPLLASGRLKQELAEKCTPEPRNDLVALAVRARWADGRRGESVLVDRYDPKTNLTAMSRTTAFTTSVTAQWVAERLASGKGLIPGVRPLEMVAKEPRAVDFVLSRMAERGVKFTRTGG
jgi:saccharopine dehydrogenase-like NADP-dependent oxidoreductase